MEARFRDVGGEMRLESKQGPGMEDIKFQEKFGFGSVSERETDKFSFLKFTLSQDRR